MLSRRAWLLIGVVTLAYVVGLAFDVSPYLRGPDEWRWPLFEPARWDRVWPMLFAMAAIAVWVVWLDRRLKRAVRPGWLIAVGVSGLMLAAPAVQLLALRTERVNPIETLLARATDIWANGYFSVGTDIPGIDAFLREYPARMPGFPIHPQVHPPGIPLIYWLAGLALQSMPPVAEAVSHQFRQMECNDLALMMLPDAPLSSALAGMILPVLANVLTVACVFKLARNRFGDRAGIYASAFWAVVPSAVLFAGLWAQVFPLLACLIWLCVDAGLSRRAIGPFFVAGLILSIATFMELGTSVLALFLALYVLARYVNERRNPLADWRFLLRALAAGAVGAASIWIVYQAAYGVSLGQIVNAMLPIHTGYEFDRLLWMVNHPYEFVVFLGLPLAGLLIVAFVRALKSLRAGQADALSLSFGVGLIILSLIDPARDETARTWLLLMPFAVIVAAQVLVHPQARPREFVAVWGLLGVQLVVMTATLLIALMALFGRPPDTALTAVPAGVPQRQADFGGIVRLIGSQIDSSTQPDRVSLDAYWRPTQPIHHPYVLFAHLVDAEDRIVAQLDARSQPLMTCWQPGAIYHDPRSIPVAPDLPGGTYTLNVGLYNSETGARLPVTLPDGTESDHVTLGPVQIKRP